MQVDQTSSFFSSTKPPFALSALSAAFLFFASTLSLSSLICLIKALFSLILCP